MRKYRRIKLSYAERALQNWHIKELRRFRQISMIMLAGFLGMFQSANASPQGEHVVSGSADFNRNGTVTEITASDNAIINYDSFNIASDETVRFIQPSEVARVLNRIQGEDPTTIAGQLLANGQVYIVNPAGIYFTNGSLVDVGELYAAAGDILDTEFLAGIDHFTNVSGEIVNDGRIVAETTALVGRYIANNGEIISADGLVTLAVGDDVYLTRRGSHIMVQVGFLSQESGNESPAIDNSGSIDAGKGTVSLVSGDMYALAMGVNSSGSIKASDITLESGNNGITTVSGSLDATGSTEGHTGGTIKVIGDRVGLLGADVDASGSAGGGEVYIGGNYQGSGPLRNAEITDVNSEAQIRADALDSGDGGKVICWADKATYYMGDISVKGGAEAGDGGFVEVSGKENLHFTGAVDTSAENGEYGTLLLDPENVGILGDAFDNDTHNGYLTDDNTILEGEYPGVTLYIGQSAIESLVGNITIYANNLIAFYGLAGNTLNLQTAAGSTASFLVDQDFNQGGNAFETDYSGPANDIVTNGGNVLINAQNVTVDTITTNGGDITIRALDIDLKSGLNAGAGDIHLYPRSSSHMDVGQFTDGFEITNSDLQKITTSGTLTIGDPVYTTSMELEGINNDLAGVTGTVVFMSNGTINSTNGFNNTFLTPDVQILADDGVTLASDLNVTNSLIINADSDSDGTGTLTIDENTDNITAGSTVAVTAANLVFNNTGAGMINAASDVTLYASNNRSMGTSGFVFDYNISNNELNSISSGGTLTLDTASTFKFNVGTTYTGNLAVIAGDDITQINTLDVTGNLSLATDVSGANIVLDDTGNDVSGTVSLASVGTGDVTWYEGASVNLGTSNIGSDLTVRSNTSTITQSGVVTTGGNASFLTSANDRDIILNTQNNAVGGTVTFTTNNTSGDVFWKEDAAVSLAASTIDGNLTVVSNTSTISQTGALDVLGDADFTTSANNCAITLGNTSNDVTGQVTFTTAGTTGNVTFDNGSHAIDFGASTINGTLNLDTGGHLTVNGAVTTTGSATINADDITMTSTLSSGTADITIVVDDNGSLGLGGTAGNMTLTDSELDNITSSGTVWFDTNGNITVDTITPANMTGTVRIDSAGSVSFINGASTFGGGLQVLGDDLVISQALNVTGSMQVTGVGTALYLGDGGGANMDISGAELQNISAANLEINAGTNQNIYVNNITAVNSDNISGTVTLDSSQAVIFQTASSTFNALTVEADDGVQINDGIDITTDTGAMSFDGNVISNGSTVAIATDVILDSAGNFTIHETTAGGNVDITATNINIVNTVNYGANDVTISSAGSVDIGNAATGAMVISGTELQRLSGTGDVTITTSGGDVTVNNITAANSDNIDGLLTVETTGNGNKVVFSGNNSTFNTLTVNAPDGIDINNVMLATDTGALTLNPDTDGGGELITFIGTNAGMTTATDFTLGSISVTDALTLRANGNIRFTANQNAPDGFNIYADYDGVGGGTFTVDAGVDLTTVNSDINITGVDFVMGAGASMDAGSGDVTFGTQQAVALKLGAGAANFGISDTELDAMTAANVVIGGVSSAQFSSVQVDGDFTAGNKTLTIETDGTFTIIDTKTLSTTDEAITINSDDLIMNTTGAIDSGTAALTLNTMAVGTDVVLGGTGQEYNIDDTELSNITSGSLNITVKADDDIYVSGISDAGGENAGDIVLDATGAGSKIFIDTASVQVDSLSASASDGININQNITADSGNLLLEGDAGDAADGTDNLSMSNGLTFSAAGSISLGATNGGVNAAGALTLNAQTGISIADAYTAFGAGSLLANADTDGDGTGTFTASSTVTTVDSLVSITAADIVLGGVVDAGIGGISILTSDTGGESIAFGTGAADMSLSAAEVGYLTTTGTLTVGNANTTTLTVSTAPSNATGNQYYTANAVNGNIVVSATLSPSAILSMLARDGIAINSSITTGGTVTINADTDAAGNGTLSLGAGVTVDSTDNVTSLSAKDLDIDGSAALDSGTAAMSITQTQAAGTIGLGATAGTMTINDSELDNITANGFSIFAPSDVTFNGITNNGANISGTFLVDADGKVTFATTGSDFKTLEVQADDGVEVNNVTVSTGVGSIDIDANVDGSSDTTDTIAFVGVAGLSANTTLDLAAANDGITSGGATTLSANSTVTISDKFVASSDLSITSVDADVSIDNNLTGGGLLVINADDGIDFNGNIVLGGAATIDADTDAGDNDGTFTLAALKTITTNGHAMSISADDIDFAGSVSGGAGVLTFDVSDGGTIGVADGSGDLVLSSAELTRITGQTGGMTYSGSDGVVNVDGMTTDSNLAGIGGTVTINATNNGASVLFDGAASKCQALTVNADDGIEMQVDLTTAGNMSLNGDFDNADDAGSDDIKLVGARTLTANGGSLTLSAATGKISDNAAVVLSAKDGITINDDFDVTGQVTIDADSDNDTTGTLSLAGTIVSNDNLVDIVADDLAITTGGINSGTANTRLAPSTAISIGLGAAGGSMSITDAELDSITAENLYLGMGVATDISANNVTTSAIADTIYIDITGTLLTTGSAWDLSGNNIDLDIIADDINYGADIDTGTGGQRYRTDDAGGICLGAATMGMNLSGAELQHIISSGTVTFETQAGERIDINNIGNGSTDNITGTLVLDADSNGSQVNFTTAQSVLKNDVIVNADDGIDIEVDLTVQSGSLTINGDSDSASDGNSRDYINISDGITIETTADDLTLSASSGNILADGALTLISGGNMTIASSLTTNNGVSTDKVLTIEAADLDLTGSALNAEAGPIFIRPSGIGDMGLGGTATGGLDFTDAEFDKITTSGTVIFGGASAGDIVIDGFTAPATVTGDIIFVSGQDNCSVTFSSANSSFLAGLTVNALDDIIFNRSVTVNGDILIDADTDNDNDGILTVAATMTVDSTDHDISITANDMSVSGTINATSKVLTITDSDDDGIGLGATPVANGLNLTGLELQNLYAGDVDFITKGNVVIDGVTSANSNNMAGVTTIDTEADIQFNNTASTFNALSCVTDGNISVNTDITTDTGALVLSGDQNGNAGAVDSITFADGVTAASATSMTLTASSGGALVSGIDCAGAVDLEAVSHIFLNNTITAGGLLTLNADTDIDGTGDLTIAVGAGVNAAGNNVAITANTVTFGAGLLTNVDDLALHATVLGDLTVNGDFGNTGSVELVSMNGSLTINSQITSNESFVLTAQDGITINNNIIADADANSGGTESISINADSDADGTGALTLTTNTKSITTNDCDMDIIASDLIMQDDYELVLGTGKLTVSESHSDGIGFGATGIASGLDISTGELVRISADELELVTGGDVVIDNITELSNDNINTITIDCAGEADFVNNTSIFNTLIVEADNGIVIEQNITSGDGGSLSLDGDANIAADGSDDIQIVAGIVLQADNAITLAAQTGKIIAAGTLDLLSEGDITINDNLTASDVITINTDGITVDSDGTGDFITAADATISTEAVNEEINITANDMFNNGYLRTGTSTVNITVSDDQNYYLGSNAVEDGSNNGYNINATELSHLYTGNLNLATAGNINISDILAGSADNITYMVTFTIDGHAVLSNDCIFNAITIIANDGIELGGNLASQTGSIILEGDFDDGVSIGGHDNIQFASGSTVSSADTLVLDATTGALTGLGSLVLEAADGITINDDLNTNGDLTINADSNTDGTGELTSNGTYACNGNDLNITAAIVDFNSSITDVNDLYLTATTGDMNLLSGSFDNTGDLGLTVTNGRCAINQVLTSAGAITISASDGIDITRNISSNGDMIINADNNADASGDLSVSAGVAINSNDGLIGITAKDISDLEGTINSGTNVVTIDSTGIGIALGTSSTSGMKLTNSELSKITADSIEFITDGDINVGAVQASANNNIDIVILDAEGEIRFERGTSVFNCLDVQAEGGIVINSDLTTDRDELYFNNDSSCLSGGNHGITFANGVTVTSAEGLTIGGSGDLSASGDVNFVTHGDMEILSDFNIADNLNVDVEGYDLTVDNVDIVIADGSAEIYAGDIELAGSMSAMSGTILLVPYDQTAALGNAAASFTVDNSELESISADRLNIDAGGNITVDDIYSSSTSAINTLTLDSEQEVLFADALIDSNLEVYAGSGISQSARLTVSGTSLLETNQADQTIILDNSENSLVGAVTFNSISNGDDLADVVLNNGDTAIILDGALVAGDLTLVSGGAVSQLGALNITGDMDISVTFDNNGITLGDPANSINGTVAFYTSAGGDVSFNNGSDDIVIAQAIIGGSAAMVSQSSITDIGSVAIAGDTAFATYSDSGADIVLDNADNTFGMLDVFCYDSSGNVYSDGNIHIIENDSVLINNIATSGELVINAVGSVTELGTMDIAGAATITANSDTNSDIILNGSNSFGAIDITADNSGNISVTEAGIMEITSITASGAVSLIADDMVIDGDISGSQLTIAPLSNATSIAVGDDASGVMKLTNVELGRFIDGFERITIGRTDATGDISVSEVGFTDAVELETGGAIYITGEISGLDQDTSISVVAGSGIFTDSDITTVGNDILLTGGLTCSEAVSISTSSSGGSITIEGDIDTVNGVDILAGSHVSLNSVLSNSGAGIVNITGDIVLAGDVTIEADHADVSIGGLVDGLYDLSVNTSEADIVFAEDMGISQELANLSVITSGVGTIAFNSTINVAGDIYISSDQDAGYVPSGATIFKNSVGDLVFNVGGDFEVGLNNRMTVSNGDLVINSIAGIVKLGDTTVKENIIVDAAGGDGDIVLMVRDRAFSYVLNKNGTLKLLKDKGVNLAAEGYIQLNGEVLAEGEGNNPYFVTGNKKDSSGLQGYKVYTIREFDDLIAYDEEGNEVVIVYIPVNENKQIIVDPVAAAVLRDRNDVYCDSQIGNYIYDTASEGVYIPTELEKIDFADMWDLR